MGAPWPLATPSATVRTYSGTGGTSRTSSALVSRRTLRRKRGWAVAPPGPSRLSPSKAFARARGSLGGLRDPRRSRILQRGSALRSQKQLTGGPGRPCSPVKPRWPFSPLSPASPVSPLSPRGPWGPWERGRGRVRLGMADPCPRHPGPRVSHVGRASGLSTTHRHASSASRTGGTHGPLCTLRGEKRESKGAGTGVVPRGASTPKHPQPRGREDGVWWGDI